MDTPTLLERHLEDGRLFLHALDEAKFETNAAMWRFDGELSLWRYLLASVVVNQSGPQIAYRRVLSVLHAHPNLAIDLLTLAVVRADDEFIAALASGIRMDPGGSGKRLTRNRIHGAYVEDAYIYRVQRVADLTPAMPRR